MSALHATNRQSIHTDVLNILQVYDLLINEKSGTEQLSLDLLFYVKLTSKGVQYCIGPRKCKYDQFGEHTCRIRVRSQLRT